MAVKKAALSGALAAFAGLALAAVTPSLNFAQAGGLALADQQGGDENARPNPGGDGPVQGEGQQDQDEPSEDGTDDHSGTAQPGTTEPDPPPGCPYRGGPMELLI